MTNRGNNVYVLLLAGLALGAPAAPAPGVSPEDLFACRALAALDLSEDTGADARILAASVLPADQDHPALCQVSGRIGPGIGFEARLPLAGWNRRLLFLGCVGDCAAPEGGGPANALVAAAARGYASATTDVGARDPGLPVATHLATVAAREIAAGYYGQAPEQSYFRGCGTGGRQGLLAADRFPGDYDGIIAGAPFSAEFTRARLASALAANRGADGRPLLRRKDFELLHRAALAACDEADGERDGVIADPVSCRFDPASLACPAPGHPPGGACLTPDQVRAATSLYAGPRDDSGAALGPGGAPAGSELALAALLLPEETRPGRPARAEAMVALDLPPGVPGFTPDLERFRALGGRLVVYQGAADATVAPAETLDWWQRLVGSVGGPGNGTRFARLYLVPGLGHCGAPGEPDGLEVLERWTGQGEAPSSSTEVRAGNWLRPENKSCFASIPECRRP